MSMKSVRNNPTSSGFDLSRRRAFTAKAGQVEVLFADEILPGDHAYDLRTQWMTRTQPLNTAAYTRMREYVDWYFVPNNLLWNNFNTWRYKMDRNVQHAITPTGQVYLSDEHPTFTSAGIIDYLNRVDASAQKNNIFGYNRAQLTCKLLHMLGYGDYYDFASENPKLKVNNVKLSPWKLLAYQKVYADFIRDSQWEQAYSPSFNIDYMSNHTYNNNIPISQMGTTNIAGLDSETMFDMRYCNWPKDTFMGVLPNSQYGSPATVMNSSINSNFIYSMNVLSENQTSFGVGNNLQTGDVVGGSNVVRLPSGEQVYGLMSASDLSSLQNKLGSNITILALRQAEAAQKFAEVSQASAQDPKAQAEAHWNVIMNDAYSDRCRWLGGITNNIDINEVVNTNITGFNDAAIAGKGVGVANGKVEFKTEVDGVLIAIYRCVPLLDYALSGIRKANLKSKVTDYAIPEFDKTGMVQVPLIELTNNPVGVSSGFLGYAPAYYEYKTAIDDVCGAFYNGGTDIESWVAPISDEYLNQYISNVGGGTLSLTYTFFKVNPNILNPIFGVNAGDSVSTDQFLINSYVDFKPVRKLDYDGLPY